MEPTYNGYQNVISKQHKTDLKYKLKTFLGGGTRNWTHYLPGRHYAAELYLQPQNF